MDSRKVSNGDTPHSKSKSGSKEKSKSGSKETSKSKKTSSENRDKALDVMFNYAVTSAKRPEGLIRALHQLSTVDKKLYTTMKRAKETENGYTKKTKYLKYIDFINTIMRKLKRSNKDFSEKDIDDKFLEEAMKLKKSVHTVFAEEVRGDVRKELGLQGDYSAAAAQKISKEVGRIWSEMHENEKDLYVSEAVNHNGYVQEFIKYVKNVIDKRKK